MRNPIFTAPGGSSFLFILQLYLLQQPDLISFLIICLNVKYLKWGIVLLIVILSVHPVKFMASNHRYSYIYYNQLVGGLKGAYGNYETDYYYVSQTEASKWLLDYLKDEEEIPVL